MPFRSVAKALQTRPDLKIFLKSERPMREIFDQDFPLQKERVDLYKQAYQNIENTPCHSVALDNGNTLNIKLECENAMGRNHYARYWLPYLFVAEALDVIQPKETTILEVTSGSAGISLAYACQALDYKLTMIAPNLLPEARIKPMREAGADLVLVDGYIDKCIVEFQSRLNTGDYFAANHSEESSNFAVHSFSRIASEFHVTQGAPDYCIIGIGNGTTTEGIFDTFRKKSDATQLFTYHPKTDGHDLVFGLRVQDIPLRHISQALAKADQVFITNQLDLTVARETFPNDPIISRLGPSSLYGISIALLVAQNTENKNLMTIGYDTVERYAP